MNKINKKCQLCKKNFNTLNSEVARGGGKYCSRKCYHKSKIGTKATKETREKMSISIKKVLASNVIPPEKRFFKFIVEDKNGCWIWIGGLLNNGYGAFYNKKTSVYRAHRFSYEMFKGKIPKGLTIDHLCRVRNCVNPDHLEAVTLRENLLRGTSFVAINAKKTKCKRGHDITKKDNYYTTNFGGRNCKKCVKLRKKPSIESLAMNERMN